MRLMVALFLALASCRDNSPPTPTAQEADQLNEAEDMLNAMAGNEEGPGDRAPGPSNSSD